MSRDAELLAAWKAGDKDAGEALIERHLPALHRFFRNKAEGAVGDLTQQTLLACLEHADRLRDKHSFRAFLFGIARNQLLMLYRRRGATRIAERSVAELTAGSSSPSALVARREEHRLLQQALRQLPLDLQIVTELYYWEDLPMKEIAQVVDAPAGTVHSRLDRARKTLRRTLEQYEADPELGRQTASELDSWARSLRDFLGR